jgi:hypothetical protein
VKKTYDGFLEQHSERLAEVRLHESLHVNRALINRSMNCPILRLMSQFLRFPLQQHGSERLRYSEQCHHSEESGENKSHPSSPPPPQMTLGNKLSNNWSSNRTQECSTSKPSGGYTTTHSIPEINISTGDDGNGSCTEAAGEEPGEHNRMDVLGYGDGDLEDCEEGKADEEGLGAAIDFGKGGPDKRPCVLVSPMFFLWICIGNRGGDVPNAKPRTYNDTPRIITSLLTSNSIDVTVVAVENTLLENETQNVMIASMTVIHHFFA